MAKPRRVKEGAAPRPPDVDTLAARDAVTTHCRKALNKVHQDPTLLPLKADTLLASIDINSIPHSPVPRTKQGCSGGISYYPIKGKRTPTKGVGTGVPY